MTAVANGEGTKVGECKNYAKLLEFIGQGKIES
jgi:hypothetical protein